MKHTIPTSLEDVRDMLCEDCEKVHSCKSYCQLIAWCKEFDLHEVQKAFTRNNFDRKKIIKYLSKCKDSLIKELIRKNKKTETHLESYYGDNEDQKKELDYWEHEIRALTIEACKDDFEKKNKLRELAIYDLKSKIFCATNCAYAKVDYDKKQFSVVCTYVSYFEKEKGCCIGESCKFVAKVQREKHYILP